MDIPNKYIRLLQFLVGTDVDGDWGKNSCAAADSMIEKLSEMYDGLQDMIRRKEVNENGNT